MSDTAKAAKRKDARVELLRILACLLVILMHVRTIAVLPDGTIADWALLANMLSAPGVGLYFLICGCFIPRAPVFRAWKSFLLRILLPAFLFIIAADLLDGWLSGECGILQSILSADIKGIAGGIVQGILRADAWSLGRCTGHLWFLFSYFTIMLWMPLMHAVVMGKGEKALLFFVILSIVSLLIVDYATLFPVAFAIPMPQLPPWELMYAAAGYLLYQGIKRPSKTGFFGAAGLTVLMCVLMFFAQKALYLKGLAEGGAPADVGLIPYYLNCLSGLCAVCAMAIAAAVFFLPEPEGKLHEVICTIGGVTYPVFLLHFPIIYKIRTLGLENAGKNAFVAGGAAGNLLFTLLYTLVVFVISGLLGYGLQKLFGVLRKHLPVPKQG